MHYARQSLALLLLLPLVAGKAVAPTPDQITLKDLSLDRPLVLDQDADYVLENVTINGVHDSAALTLAGRVRSVDISGSSFGRIIAGTDGRSTAFDAAGAIVNRLVARESMFFDAEDNLVSMREGAFGRVTFERCRFYTTDEFLVQLYENQPGRNWPPVTEFYNIERLELLDNEYANTVVIIHPSVRQVILRGKLPGLQIEDAQLTQVIHLPAGQRPESVPMRSDSALAMVN